MNSFVMARRIAAVRPAGARDFAGLSGIGLDEKPRRGIRPGQVATAQPPPLPFIIIIIGNIDIMLLLPPLFWLSCESDDCIICIICIIMLFMSSSEVPLVHIR